MAKDMTARKAAVTFLLVLASATALHAQQNTPVTPTLHEMFVEDQKDREPEKPDWDKVSVHDRQHRERVHKLLEAGALKTGQDFEEAAFIFQHGDKPQDYLLAHILAMAAVERGRSGARWIAAATLDRYLQSIKQPQVFGTQYRWDYSDPKASQDPTQQPYDKELISDALREEFCVASYAGQQQNLDALKHNKEMPSPDHCPKAAAK